MITVEVKINGRLIEEVHAVNTGHKDSLGQTKYDVWEGDATVPTGTIHHSREQGALALSSRLLTLLQSLKESRHETARPGPK